MPTVNIQNSLLAGVQKDLLDFWKQPTPAFEVFKKLMTYPMAWKPIRNMPLAWKESIPFVSLWPYGDGRKYKTFKDRVMYAQIFNYELSIPFSKFDEEDDQLGDLRAHVQMCVQSYKKLPTILTMEYLNGVAVYNNTLLNAYDGVSVFSDVDGDGAARFGATGGNIVTGSGVTVAAVLKDFAVAQQRFMAFQDPTAGLPIFAEGDADYKNMVAIIPTSLNEVFQKASNAEMIRTDLTNNTSESNYLKGTFRYEISPYLTDTSDWYIVLEHPYYKPFFYSEKPMESIVADMSNSDRSREYNENTIYTHVRNRIGVWFPGVIIKINN